MRLDWTTTSLRGSLLLLISLAFDRIKLYTSYLMQICQAILVLRSAYSPQKCFSLSDSLQLGKMPQNPNKQRGDFIYLFIFFPPNPS